MGLAEENPKFIQIRRSLRFVWLVLVISMGFVSYVLFHAITTPLPRNPVMQILAGTIGAMSFFMPEFLGRNLKGQVGADPLDAKLGKIMVTHILRFALTEAALVVLLLSNQDKTPISAIVYFAAAVVLMIFHFPNDGRLARLMGNS